MVASSARYGSTERTDRISVIGWKEHPDARSPSGAKSALLVHIMGALACIPASHHAELGTIHNLIAF
jgi:hypothetical protein